MSNLSTQPYKGTRDYYPDEKSIQSYIFAVWRKVTESFGYQEYGAPTLEPLEMYIAKSGQELAGEQTYSFVDRGGRTVAIRPEMTPTICRMIAARRQELAYPARVYSIANFMRYERPQRGREREFWQLNVDIFGADNILAEVEIITLTDKIMQAFGATSADYVIKINNRKLTNFLMAQYFGLQPAKAQALIKLFDRKDKIIEQEFFEQATKILEDQTETVLPKIKQLLAAKTMADLPDEVKNNHIIDEIQELFTALERGGINAIFDITLMRGFDYYTGTVFEVFDKNPENSRSLFGGGRYDGLVELFGVEPLSAVGVAPGETTMEDFLRTHNLLPKIKTKIDASIIVLDNAIKEASKLADNLRRVGLNIEQDVSGYKFDKKLKMVLKKRIPYVIFIGEDELKSGRYTVKNIVESSEQKLTEEQIVDLLKEKNENIN